MLELKITSVHHTRVDPSPLEEHVGVARQGWLQGGVYISILRFHIKTT